MGGFSGITAQSGLTEVLTHFPRNSAPLLQLLDRIMCAEGALTRGEREAIAAHVSGLNDVGYCVFYHQMFSEVFSGPVAETQARIRPLLAYADALHRNDEAAIDRSFAAAIGAGWHEAALYEVVEVCGIFSFINMIVRAMGLATPEQRPDPQPTAGDLAGSYADMAAEVRRG